jgi:FemAB family protein
MLTEQGCWPNELLACSEWHQQLMSAGAMIQIRHDLFADLRPDLATIRSTFRKSYRPLINLALKTWQANIMDANAADAGAWAEFKQLHKDVAGRSTRSDDTWARQWQILCANEAFLVTLRDTVSQRLVGAGLFQYTRDEGLYAVGAYDRTLFHKPLGHAVQQRAIETLKDLGVRWYLVGERHYRQSPYNPSPKEVSIGEFKQGFSSHLFCRHQFMLEVPQGVGS